MMPLARCLRPIVRPAATVAILFLLHLVNAPAQAIKVPRPRPRPKPALFIFTSLTVTASPAAVTFTLVHGGTATGSSAIAVTVTWANALSLNGQLYVYGYFASAANALTGGTPSSSIPSSDVYGKVPTGFPTSYTAFTQTTPYTGASGLELYEVTSLPSNSGSRSDNLSLQIDLAATPQLPAAVYTGTLYLEAQSF
jgi:hypothetical protein